MYTNNTLIAANITDHNLPELASQVSRQLAKLSNAGARIQSVTILPRPTDWIATIVHTQPQAAAKQTAGYIKVADLAEHTYYDPIHCRELLAKHKLTLHRGPGRGGPLYISLADAHTFIAHECPGVNLDAELAGFARDLPLLTAAA